MTSDRQKQFLVLIASGKYRVDTDRGIIETFFKKETRWVPLQGNLLDSGYRQYILRDLERKKFIIYGHIAVWLAAYGLYNEMFAIKHKNEDRADNRRQNLYIDVDEEYLHEGEAPPKPFEPRKIRKKEIQAIKDKLVAAGANVNISKIARELNLNRSSVSYTANKIWRNKKLYFEDRELKKKLI